MAIERFKVLCERCKKYFLPASLKQTRWHQYCLECKALLMYKSRTYKETFPVGSKAREKRKAYMREYLKKRKH